LQLFVSQGRKLQEAGVQPLELAFAHGVEVDASNALLGTRALQPTEEDLGGTGIGDCALSQTSSISAADRCGAPLAALHGTWTRLH
jgi:hypothetical protein